MKRLQQKLFKKGIEISLLSLIVIYPACKSEESVPQVDCNDSNLSVQVLNQTDTECSLANGSVTLVGTGGSGGYTYKIGSRSYQENPTFSELAAGNYTVTVRDGSNCEASAAVSVINNEGVNMAVSFTTAGCGENKGSITITPSNGTPPYQYKLSDDDFQDGNVFSSLPHGSYTVITKDATGCEVSQEVAILSGISYSGTVSAIIQNNCAVSGCHNGSQAPDLRSLSNIQANATSIKSAVVSKRMPLTGSLSQTEIDAIACWVDDGAPDN